MVNIVFSICIAGRRCAAVLIQCLAYLFLLHQLLSAILGFSRRYFLRNRRLSPNLRINGVEELAAKDCVNGLPGFAGKTP